ncbi:hypothetical protein HPB51_010541 [Rhipicephalus microplus]|uniref:Uncharacterized protein n=1 Tax=Rhipicephalus microplus TaxID=6941 RepID=A0A9J6D939_RHIMP|nr:hypothetical protein HPB51_010541 [Rhipicephalus microplus]
MQASLCTESATLEYPPPANCLSLQQPSEAAKTPKNAIAHGPAPLPQRPLPPAKTTTVFSFLAVAALKPATQPTHSAQSSPAAPPALPSPQVAVLQQENASLLQQLASKISLLEEQTAEIKSLQAQLSTLEQKLGQSLTAYLLFPRSHSPHRTWTLNWSTGSAAIVKGTRRHLSLHTFLRRSKQPSKRPKRISRSSYIAASTQFTS